MSLFRNLIREVHRRSLWQVLGIYAAVSWVCFEVIATLTDAVGLPGWVPSAAIVLFLIGLPVVLATAFVQEAPPELGRVREGDVPREGGPDDVVLEDDDRRPIAAVEPRTAVRRVLTWRNAILGGVGAFSLLALGAGGAMVLRPPAPAVENGPRVVAALPFENMSPDPDDAYFTDGVHDEILAQLAGIGSLRVISRTSVMEYRQTTKNLREIGSELGARYILEGSVRRFADRVKITAQLIDAATDQHLWAATYERRRDDLFAIQADVAEQITRALHAELSPEERARIEAVPTSDARAHDLYLQANAYLASGRVAGRRDQEERWRAALDLYRQALERDSTFALGMAALAVHLARLHWFGFGTGEEDLRAARALLDRALRLAPHSADVHVADGIYWYWARREYSLALDALERAGAVSPAFAEASTAAYRGFILRRQGRFEDALRWLRTAADTDPRNTELLSDGSQLALELRQFDLAREYLERAAVLAPTYPGTFGRLARLSLVETGDPRRALAELDRYGGESADHLYARAWYHLYARDYDEALGVLGSVADTMLLDRQNEVWPVSLVAGFTYQLQNRQNEAREHYALARRVLENAAPDPQRAERQLTTLALAKAGLGLREGALTDARRATELLPRSVDAWIGDTYEENLAWTHVLLGDVEPALDILEALARTEIPPHPELLRLDPRWDPLRGHPRFQKLLKS